MELFWFRLAGHLKATVDELKDRITWKEFIGWRAFSGIHGLDDVRIEAQLGQIAASFFNAKGGHAKPSEFMPYREPEQQSDADMQREFHSIQ